MTCPLIVDSSKQSYMRKFRKQHFDKSKKITDSDIDDQSLDFFSLVMSYILATPSQNRENGPKHSLPVMPRTDFATIYNLYIKDKIKAQLECNLLTDIIDELAVKLEPDRRDLRQPGRDGEVHGVTDQIRNPNYHSRWANTISPQHDSNSGSTRGRASSREMTWPSKASDLSSGTLGVGTWIDGLEFYEDAEGRKTSEDRLAAMDDLLRGGQIGSLGRKTELVSNTAYAIPIFEFRDLGSVAGNELEKSFEELEDYLTDLYESNVRELKPRVVVSSPRNSSQETAHIMQQDIQIPEHSIDARNNIEPCQCRRKKLKMKKPGQCHKCPTGQVRLPSNTKSAKAGTCKACPKGQKPNLAATQCILECPEHQKPSPSGGTCQLDCPKGRIADTKGDECILHCPKGQKPNSAGNGCIVECPTGKMANIAGSNASWIVPREKSLTSQIPIAYHFVLERTFAQLMINAPARIGLTATAAISKRIRNSWKQLENFQQIVDEAAKKEKEREERKKKQNEEAERKERANRIDEKFKKQQHKMCLSFLAAGVASEIFNPVDLEEAGEEWPEDVVIDWRKFQPLTESNIGLPSPPMQVTNIVSVGSVPGLGAAAQGITTAIRDAIKGGSRAGPKAAGASTGRNIVGNGGKAATKGSELSKKTIQGFKSEKSYRPCLLGTSTHLSAAGGASIYTGPEIPYGGYARDLNDEVVGVRLCENEDCGANSYYPERQLIDDWSSYPDALNRADRIEIGECTNAGELIRGKVSAFTVTGGCCVFYSDLTCRGASSVFAANYREDQNLKGDSNDIIQSFMCNHEQCANLPYGYSIKDSPSSWDVIKGGSLSYSSEPQVGSDNKLTPPEYQGGKDTKDLQSIEVKPKSGTTLH